MKSAIVFRGKGLGSGNENKILSLIDFFQVCKELAEIKHKEVEILLQHSLKEERFAILVEMGRVRFSYHSEDPIRAFNDVTGQIGAYLIPKIKAKHVSSKKEKHTPRKTRRR